MDGWICLLLHVMFPLRAFYSIQITYIEPYGKNYQADTDALNKNLVQYRGEVGLSKHPLWMKCFTNQPIW